MNEGRHGDLDLDKQRAIQVDVSFDFSLSFANRSRADQERKAMYTLGARQQRYLHSPRPLRPPLSLKPAP